MAFSKLQLPLSNRLGCDSINPIKTKSFFARVIFWSWDKFFKLLSIDCGQMHLNVVVIKVAKSFILILNIHCGFIRQFDDLTLRDIFYASLKLWIDVPLFKLVILLANDGVVHHDFIFYTHHSFNFSMFSTVVALSFYSVNVFKVYILFVICFIFLVDLNVFLKEGKKSFAFDLSLQTFLPFLPFFKHVIVDIFNVWNLSFKSKRFSRFRCFITDFLA